MAHVPVTTLQIVKKSQNPILRLTVSPANVTLSVTRSVTRSVTLGPWTDTEETGAALLGWVWDGCGMGVGLALLTLACNS